MFVHLAVALVLGQEPAKGPASDEIAALAKADQAVRQFTDNPPPEVWKRIKIGDLARESRVRQLLRKDLVRTKEDLGHAALIFQHGSDPEDNELARELAILGCSKGNLGSLPALAEDRFLISIGKLQRFGSQFGWGPDGKPAIKDLDEGGEAAVTDALRLDFLTPPVRAQREKGLAAFQEIGPAITKRVEEAHDKTFMAKAAKSKEAFRLRKLFREGAGKRLYPRIADEVLSFYRRDSLRTPESLYQASVLLLSSTEERTVLLSNELAALSAMRGYGPAKRVFARTWDKYLTIIGRRGRYGTVGGSSLVCPIVRREFVPKG